MTDQINAALQVLENGVSRQQQQEALRQLLATRLVTPIWKAYVFRCLLCGGDTHYQVEVQGWDFPCCREHRGEEQGSPALSTLTPSELLDLNAPIRAKLDSRQPLTDEEQQLHSAICDEALRRMDALRQSDRQERDVIMAARQADQDRNATVQCEDGSWW